MGNPFPSHYLDSLSFEFSLSIPLPTCANITMYIHPPTLTITLVYQTSQYHGYFSLSSQLSHVEIMVINEMVDFFTPSDHFDSWHQIWKDWELMVFSSCRDNIFHCLFNLSFIFNLDPPRLFIHPILCGVYLPPSPCSSIIPLDMDNNCRKTSLRLDQMEQDIEDLRNFVQTIQ